MPIGGSGTINQGSPISDTKVLLSKNGVETSADSTPRKLNLIEGTNITITDIENIGNDEYDVTIASTGGGGSPQDLLDGVNHQDTLIGSVLQGDLIKGNGTPLWARFPRGTSLQQIRVNAGGTDLEYFTPAGGSAHDILSSTHDAITATVVQGDLLLGNGTPLWDRLGIGTVNQILLSNGTTLAYGLLVNANVDAGANIAQSKLASIVLGDLPNLPTLGTLPASPRQIAIVNAEIDAGANIAQSKLASILLANLPIGSAFQRYRTNSGATAIENFTEESALVFIIGDGSAVITTGVKVHLRVPFACEINLATLLNKESGSIVVDVNRFTSLANFNADTKASITSATPPTTSSARSSEDSTLTSWTVVLNQGDILEAEVDSATTVTRTTLSLKVDKRG